MREGTSVTKIPKNAVNPGKNDRFFALKAPDQIAIICVIE